MQRKNKFIIGGVAAVVLIIGGCSAAATGGSGTTATTAGSTTSSPSAAPTTPTVTKVTVPSLAGLTPAQVTAKLKALGLTASPTGDMSNPQFGVLTQDPAAGTSVNPGIVVKVTIGESPEQAAARQAAEAKAAADAEAARVAAEAAAAAAAADADLATYQEIDERTWALVAKDPAAHAGEKYVIYGRVFQFDAATGTSRFLANTGAAQQEYSYQYDTTAMISATDPAKLADVVEDDIVKMYVKVTGPYSYDTRVGNGNTVTAAQVNSIEVVGHDD